MENKLNTFGVFEYFSNKIEEFAEKTALFEIKHYQKNQTAYAGPPQQLYQTWDADTIDIVKNELNKKENKFSLNEYLNTFQNDNEKKEMTSFFVEKFCDLTNQKLDDFARTGLTNEYEIYDYDMKNNIEMTRNGQRPSDGWNKLSDQEYIKQLEHGIKLNQEALEHPKNKEKQETKKTIKR